MKLCFATIPYHTIPYHTIPYHTERRLASESEDWSKRSHLVLDLLACSYYCIDCFQLRMYSIVCDMIMKYNKPSFAWVCVDPIMLCYAMLLTLRFILYLRVALLPRWRTKFEHFQQSSRLNWRTRKIHTYMHTYIHTYSLRMFINMKKYAEMLNAYLTSLLAHHQVCMYVCQLSAAYLPSDPFFDCLHFCIVSCTWWITPYRKLSTAWKPSPITSSKHPFYMSESIQSHNTSQSFSYLILTTDF